MTLGEVREANAALDIKIEMQKKAAKKKKMIERGVLNYGECCS